MNESANFLSWLINHHDFKVPLVEDPIYKVVGNSERIFGYDISLIRNANDAQDKYCVSYTLRSFPAKIKPGALDFILSIPCELTFAQSYIYTRQLTAISIIDGQANKINSTNAAIDEEGTALNSIKTLFKTVKCFLVIIMVLFRFMVKPLKRLMIMQFLLNQALALRDMCCFVPRMNKKMFL